MKKSNQPKLLSYAEYRLREAHDDYQEEGAHNGDDWSFEDPELTTEQPTQDKFQQYAPAETGDEWNWEGGDEREDQRDTDLRTLGMNSRPGFAEMPNQGNEMAAAGPGPDEDPEDWQAKQDLDEVAGVYGLNLGSTKDGKLVVQGNRKQWRQDFPDYISAISWVKQNMGKVSKR